MLSAFQTKMRNFLRLFPFVKDRFDDKITNSRMEYTVTHLIFPLAVTEIARARTATSFQGLSSSRPLERERKRPWFGLVTCLPDFSRLQISGLREGQISREFVST